MICPYCKKKEAGEKPFWPFCSARCKQLDLGAWAKEEYRVAGKSGEVILDEEEEEQLREEE